MENEVHEQEGHIHPESDKREHFKFALVILLIVFISASLTTARGWSAGQFLSDFMAVFLIIFAGFKFIHLEEFAITYRSYDLITKKFPAWGFIFPFVEAFLGLGYLTANRPGLINFITMIITGISGYGVWKAVYSKNRPRSRFQCACLGTVIRLPLSTISFVENGLMFVMATTMLLVG